MFVRGFVILFRDRDVRIGLAEVPEQLSDAQCRFVEPFRRVLSPRVGALLKAVVEIDLHFREPGTAGFADTAMGGLQIVLGGVDAVVIFNQIQQEVRQRFSARGGTPCRHAEDHQYREPRLEKASQTLFPGYLPRFAAINLHNRPAIGTY